jgi:hypothetical protein
MIKYNKEKRAFIGRIKSLDGERWIAINHEIGKDGGTPTIKDIESIQWIVYTMIGGGMLGEFAMTQPADFYIDLRVGRLPYPHRRIFHAVEILKGLAEYLGLDPHNLPKPDRLNYWIF